MDFQIYDVTWKFLSINNETQNSKDFSYDQENQNQDIRIYIESYFDQDLIFFNLAC